MKGNNATTNSGWHHAKAYPGFRRAKPHAYKDVKDDPSAPGALRSGARETISRAGFPQGPSTVLSSGR